MSITEWLWNISNSCSRGIHSTKKNHARVCMMHLRECKYRYILKSLFFWKLLWISGDGSLNQNSSAPAVTVSEHLAAQRSEEKHLDQMVEGYFYATRSHNPQFYPFPFLSIAKYSQKWNWYFPFKQLKNCAACLVASHCMRFCPQFRLVLRGNFSYVFGSLCQCVLQWPQFQKWQQHDKQSWTWGNKEENKCFPLSWLY